LMPRAFRHVEFHSCEDTQLEWNSTRVEFHSREWNSTHARTRYRDKIENHKISPHDKWPTMVKRKLPDFFEDSSAPALRHSTNNLRNRGAEVARVGYLQPPDLTLRFSKVKFGGKTTSRRPLNSVVWRINPVLLRN
jgi:hypothetical protein